MWSGLVVGPDVAEKRASALQRGGGDAEDAAASQHCEVLRLLRGTTVTWQARHCARNRAHDIRNSQNVRSHAVNTFSRYALRMKKDETNQANVLDPGMSTGRVGSTLLSRCILRYELVVSGDRKWTRTSLLRSALLDGRDRLKLRSI